MARGYPYLPAKSSNSRPPTLDFTSVLLSNSMGNRITSTVSLSRQKSRVHRAMRPLVSLLRPRRERPCSRCAAECGQQFPPSDGDCHTPLPCEVRKGNDTTSRACGLHIQGGQDTGCFSSVVLLQADIWT